MTTKTTQPLNIARVTVSESAAGVLTSADIQMPFSQFARGKALAPRIMRVKMDISPSNLLTVDTLSDDTLALTTRQGVTVRPQISDPGVIAQMHMAIRTTTDGITRSVWGDDWDFTPQGVLVPAITLSLVVDGPGPGQISGRAMIMYVIDEIEADELLAALSVFGALV